MEQWDIFNAEGEPTGEVVTRGKGVLHEGQYHLVVHIWVIDDKNRILIQQRSLDLEILPGKWAITGGSAVKGEDQIAAAKRELLEEVGITADDDELELLKKYRGKNDFVYVYVLRKNAEIHKIKMQPEEVQAVKWVTVKELKHMVSKKLFHNYSYLNEIYDYIK
ncbi:MAG: NUDIX domain-containing protein [Bacillota bacterium]|nr:NUDIX domain-containing protein [Bacillota bacterium]